MEIYLVAGSGNDFAFPAIVLYCTSVALPCISVTTLGKYRNVYTHNIRSYFLIIVQMEIELAAVMTLFFRLWHYTAHLCVYWVSIPCTVVLHHLVNPKYKVHVCIYM